MASEVTIARESSINPLNAIGGGQRKNVLNSAADKLREILNLNDVSISASQTTRNGKTFNEIIIKETNGRNYNHTSGRFDSQYTLDVDDNGLVKMWGTQLGEIKNGKLTVTNKKLLKSIKNNFQEFRW